MHNRGSATSIAKLFLGLIVGSIVIWIVKLTATPILDMAAEQGSGQIAADGTAWMRAGVEFFPVFILFVSFFGLIAFSVYRRELVR